MSEIFSPKQRYELWLRIELTVCEGWADLDEIPRTVLDRLRQARVDPEHIARLEERVGHDVVAFLDSLADSVGGEDARYLHRGLTSSDVLDTALALQLVQAADIRHLQRSEVSEVREPFGAEQKGSSAMPHKRNPVLSERICGLARVVRGCAQTSLENQALWHERDISHSSAERIIFPDACTLLDYMLQLMAEILEGLTIDRERMRANLYRSGGVVFSQRVLLALVQKGMSRQDAYRVVQRAALSALDDGQDFKTIVGQAPEVRERLTAEELAELFDPAYYLRHLDVTFERVGLDPVALSPA